MNSLQTLYDQAQARIEQRGEFIRGIQISLEETGDILAELKAADDLVAVLWDLEWAEDMVVGPKLRAYQELRKGRWK